jgi:hypothetical protein
LNRRCPGGMDMALESRVIKLEDRLRPQAWIYLLVIYTPEEGVGWRAEGCETEAEAMARMPQVSPQDLLMVHQAWGCDRRGTPHSHRDDPIQRWPRHG